MEENNEPIPQETNRVFRSIGALSFTINWAMLSGLIASWLTKALISANYIPWLIGYPLLFVLPFGAIFLWWLWRENYLSDNASAGEKFYRFIPLMLWFIGFVLGVIHFI